MFMKINYEVLLSIEVIITFIVALFFGIFFIWIDYREKKEEAKSNEERQKKKSFYRIRLLFTFLLGLLAIFETYNHKDEEMKNHSLQSLQDSIMNVKQDTISTLTKKLDSTSEVLNLKNDELITSQKKIIGSQGHTIRLQNELFNQITGGNSIPLITVSSKLEKLGGEFTGKVMLITKVKNSGKYPINNLEIKYVDFERVTDPHDHYAHTLNVYLPSDTSLILNQILVDNKHQYYDHIWRYIVSWKNYYYIFQFTLRNVEYIPNPAFPIQAKFKPDVMFYEYHGKKLKTVRELEKQLRKEQNR